MRNFMERVLKYAAENRKKYIFPIGVDEIVSLKREEIQKCLALSCEIFCEKAVILTTIPIGVDEFNDFISQLYDRGVGGYWPFTLINKTFLIFDSTEADKYYMAIIGIVAAALAPICLRGNGECLEIECYSRREKYLHVPLDKILNILEPTLIVET